jgi:hypothetical protein
MIAAKQTAYLVTRALTSCILLVAISIALNFLLPANKAALDAYHLSSIQYKIILFAVSLPSYLVWFTAFVGYSKLYEYAAAVKNTPEGKHYYKLARGGAWLAWSLPLSKIFSTILSAIDNAHPGFHSTAIILGNYFSLILSLVAFSLIASAARRLLNDAKLRLSPAITKSIIIAFVVAGVSYCYLVFRHFDMTSLTKANNGYFLPIWLMLLTIIIPYLYIWFIGLLSACDLAVLAAKARGHLYKRAQAYLVAGLVIVLMGSVAIQYVHTIQPVSGHLLIDASLALTLIFRVLQGVGFVLMTVGAIKLRKIEEV